MNKYKIVAGALVAAMLVGVVPVQAATGVGETNVSYSNDNNIPDPDNPNDPHWAVAIPSSITFTDKNRSADATVELKSMNGYDLPTGGTITVKVTSTNSYGLHAVGADKDIMPYTLSYGANRMTASTNTVGDLVATNKIEGTAVLDANATAKVKGSHTDTLEYSIETASVVYS